MTTIAYDRPVKDLIAGLDATGHVTHTQHRKTHVTLHHNGARLSHEGVLQVWQTREASAHFDCDAVGDVAQYVRVAEYAWATGSTEGNQRSISIEMANETLSPDWKVREATWRSAARLAGWLFARVIGARPTRDTLVMHKVWSATSCAGPYIDQVYDKILAVAQETFDNIIYNIAVKEFGMTPQIRRGSVGDEIWLVTVHPDGGVSKVHVKDGRLVQAYEAIVGEGKVVDQWKLDWFAKTGEIG